MFIFLSYITSESGISDPYITIKMFRILDLGGLKIRSNPDLFNEEGIISLVLCMSYFEKNTMYMNSRK